MAGLGRLPALQVWGYDFSAFPTAGTSALAILDLVSRKWIDTMLCAEATSVQVQVLFTRALEREGLLERILTLVDELDPGAEPSDLQPVLLSVSDNGAQMRSASTRSSWRCHRDALRAARDAHRSGSHRVAVRSRQARVAAPVRPDRAGRPGARARRRPRAVQHVRLHAGSAT